MDTNKLIKNLSLLAFARHLRKDFKCLDDAAKDLHNEANEIARITGCEYANVILVMCELCSEIKGE